MTKSQHVLGDKVMCALLFNAVKLDSRKRVYTMSETGYSSLMALAGPVLESSVSASAAVPSLPCVKCQSMFSAGGVVKTKHDSRCPNCGSSMVIESQPGSEQVDAGRLFSSVQPHCWAKTGFCMMMGQPMPRYKVLHDESLLEMIRITAAALMVRQERIMKELQRNNSMYKNVPYAKEFGINKAGTMAKLTGRLLPPPSIEYRQGKQVKMYKQNPGKWVQKSQDNLYKSGMELSDWAVLDLARLSKGEYEAMVQQLVIVANGVRKV